MRWAVTQAVVVGLFGALYFGVASLTPLSIPTTWATALLCLLLVDLGYYWEHRLSHEVTVFWASFHSTHHSANHYDQSVGLRTSFTEYLLNVLALGANVALIAVGFHPLLVLASYGLMLAWQQWIHTETVGRLPWLDGWLNTPSNHRVHHGRNPEYLDRNYGGIFMVWDRLFGTYTPETVPVDYGLVHRLESHHPVAVHFSVWLGLAPKLARARTWGEVGRLLLGPPTPTVTPRDAGSANHTGRR
ncbi:MAG: sterol desaturase family protein [Myxococcota bacterium]